LQCGVGCEIVIGYGNGQCAALARGTNISLGWATGTSKADASQNAVSQCQTNSGIGCISLLVECSESVDLPVNCWISNLNIANY
jgi:hypothetical protein